MALSVFTGVVYAADTDTVVILYENDVHCAIEGYSKIAEREKCTHPAVIKSVKAAISKLKKYLSK